MTSNQFALQSFQEFPSRQMNAQPPADLSPEQAVARWREEQSTLSAVQEALADVAAGRTRSLDEFNEEFRRRVQSGADR